VVCAKTLRADLVNDTTLVVVRYRADATARSTHDMPAREMLG
jgi:hypothetical protein